MQRVLGQRQTVLMSIWGTSTCPLSLRGRGRHRGTCCAQTSQKTSTSSKPQANVSKRRVVKRRLKTDMVLAEKPGAGNKLHSNRTSDVVIELNVGGAVMSTFLSTLTQVPGSRLASMFLAPQQLQHDSAGRVFLDYDPHCFALLLSWLRERKMAHASTPSSGPKGLTSEEQHHFSHLMHHLQSAPSPLPIPPYPPTPNNLLLQPPSCSLAGPTQAARASATPAPFPLAPRSRRSPPLKQRSIPSGTAATDLAVAPVLSPHNTCAPQPASPRNPPSHAPLASPSSPSLQEPHTPCFRDLSAEGVSNTPPPSARTPSSPCVAGACQSSPASPPPTQTAASTTSHPSLRTPPQDLTSTSHPMGSTAFRNPSVTSHPPSGTPSCSPSSASRPLPSTTSQPPIPMADPHWPLLSTSKQAAPRRAKPSPPSSLYYIHTGKEPRKGLRISVYTERDLAALRGGRRADIFCDASFGEGGGTSLSMVLHREFQNVFVGITSRAHTDQRGPQIPCYGWKQLGCKYSGAETDEGGPLEDAQVAGVLWKKGDCVEVGLDVEQGLQLHLRVNGKVVDQIKQLPRLQEWCWCIAVYTHGDLSSVVFHHDSYAVYWGDYAIRRYL